MMIMIAAVVLLSSPKYYYTMVKKIPQHRWWRLLFKWWLFVNGMNEWMNRITSAIFYFIFHYTRISSTNSISQWLNIFYWIDIYILFNIKYKHDHIDCMYKSFSSKKNWFLLANHFHSFVIDEWKELLSIDMFDLMFHSKHTHAKKISHS